MIVCLQIIGTGGVVLESTMRLINRIARLAQLYREKELAKYGLGGMHHTYILNICRNPGITQDQLAKLIFVNKSNVTRQLASLEKSGFVTRQVSAQDARKIEVYPTAKAESTLPAIQHILKEWNQELMAGWSEARQQNFIAELEQLLTRAQTMTYGEEGKT